MNNAWTLKRIDVFETLPSRVLQRLAATMDDRALEPGAHVFNGAEGEDCLYVLKHGRVKLSRLSGDGRELVLEVVEPGEIFGEEALGQSGRRGTLAEAVTPTDVGVIRVDDFDQLLREYPDVSVRLSRLISRRLEQAHRRMADLVFKNIAGRVAGLLLELSERFGRVEGGDIHLDTRITHQEIANRIGSTRETVTATLNGFRREGIITTQGRKLIVRDKAALQRVYSDDPNG